MAGNRRESLGLPEKEEKDKKGQGEERKSRVVSLKKSGQRNKGVQSVTISYGRGRDASSGSHIAQQERGPEPRRQKREVAGNEMIDRRWGGWKEHQRRNVQKGGNEVQEMVEGRHDSITKKNRLREMGKNLPRERVA